MRRKITPKKVDIVPIDSIGELEQLDIVVPELITIEIEDIAETLNPLPQLIINEQPKKVKASELSFSPIESSEELRKKINELFIRFNTSPKAYTKEDYLKLILLLNNGLLHVYKKDSETIPVIINLNSL